MARPRVFISYSRGDEGALKTLLPYLTTLNREGLVDLWSDRELRGGEEWRREIEAALDGASIAVLLVSQHYLASPFVRNEELPRILQRQRQGCLTILPIYIAPSTVKSESFPVRDGREDRVLLTEFQGFGTPDETLNELEPAERQRRFVDLCNRIRQLSAPPLEVPLTDRQDFDKESVFRERRITRIPLPRNRTFTGREPQLRRLHEELQSGHPMAVTQALSGLGGIGKTQLALEYCYRYGGDYRIVWWIRAEQESTRLADMSALGRALGVDAAIDPIQLVEATVHYLESRDDWLIVFDNAEHPDEIRTILPKSSGGRVVITSRYPAWGAVARTVRLSLWTADEAVAYLSRRTGLDGSAATAAIAASLGYLPLALSQAAAYIEETGCGFEGYLSLLHARPTETLMLRANSSDAEKAIATVWDIAFSRVADTNPAAIDLLNLFAFLPPDRISRALLVERADKLPSAIRQTVEDPFALDAAVGALRRYSLVDSAGATLSVHRLVQAVVRGRLDDNAYYRLLSETAKDLESKDLESSVAIQADRHSESDASSGPSGDDAPSPLWGGDASDPLMPTRRDTSVPPRRWRTIAYAVGGVGVIASMMFALGDAGDVLAPSSRTGDALGSTPTERETPHGDEKGARANGHDTSPGRVTGPQTSPQTSPQTGPPLPPLNPPLQTVTASAEIEKSLRATLARATSNLGATKFQSLGPSAREQYRTARQFIAEAEGAIKRQDWAYARTLADKAETLSKELATANRNMR